MVVYWTQRGTGRSYSRDTSASSMTIDRFVEDLHELIGHLKRRFGNQRVVIAGHSWGTSFGVAYAQKYPQNLAAYVGVSQVVNAAAGEKLSYQFTLDEANRLGNEKAKSELLALGKPPYSMASILKQRQWLETFGGGSFHKPTSLFSLLLSSVSASEVTLFDGLNYVRGANFSNYALEKENAKVDWWSHATSFAMPVFVASGRFDRNTDSRLQRAWFERIQAPAKVHRWFEESAHSPLFEESDKFNQFMIEAVLPVAELRQRENP